MDGILCIDKSVGPTSFEVVREVRRRLNLKQVGHAGTLDPLASGLLVLCIGEATKLVPYLMDSDKRYDVTVTLGEETNTLDGEGTVVKQAPVPALDVARVQAVLPSFIGEIMQLPPLYAAIKKGGERLYRKARRGEAVVLTKRAVHITSIHVLQVLENRISLRVCCKQGTYIRALARDIAHVLDTVGYVTSLRRLETSGYRVDEAIPFESLVSDKVALSEKIVPMADAVCFMPIRVLSEDRENTVRHGQPIPDLDLDAEAGDDASLHPLVRLLSKEGSLVAIAAVAGDMLKPVRVFLTR